MAECGQVLVGDAMMAIFKVSIDLINHESKDHPAAIENTGRYGKSQL
jgi:hypothetical protein